MFLCLCVDKSLTLLDVRQSDAGVYQCIANNIVGSAYATAVLSVTPSRRRATVTSQSLPTAAVSSPQPSCKLVTCCFCLSCSF